MEWLKINESQGECKMGILWDILVVVNVSALVLLAMLLTVIYIWDNCQRRISNSRHTRTDRKTTKKEEE